MKFMSVSKTVTRVPSLRRIVTSPLSVLSSLTAAIHRGSLQLAVKSRQMVQDEHQMYRHGLPGGVWPFEAACGASRDGVGLAS